MESGALVLVLALFQQVASSRILLINPLADVKCNDTICECPRDSSITCSSGVLLESDEYLAWINIICNLSGEDNHKYFNYTILIDGCPKHNKSLADFLINPGDSNIHTLFLRSAGENMVKGGFKNNDKSFKVLDQGDKLDVCFSTRVKLKVDLFQGIRNLIQVGREPYQNNLSNDSPRYHPQTPYFFIKRNILRKITLKPNFTLPDYKVHPSRTYTQIFEVGMNNSLKNEFAFDLSKTDVASKDYPFILESVDLTGFTTLSKPITRIFLGHIIKHIPKKLLISTNTSHLTLFHDILTKSVLPSGTFANLSSLESVNILRNNLKSLHEDAFHQSENIESISLDGNILTTLKENTFSNLKFLLNVILSNNEISSLPERLFFKTININYLNLAHNKLEIIEPGLFSQLSRLTTLILSNNKIKHISGDEFSNLPSLSHIDLSHNQLISLVQDPLLSDLDQSVFYNCQQLMWLYLQNNSLTEIYDDWKRPRRYVRILILANNNITDIQMLNMTYEMISTKSSKWKITTVELSPSEEFEYLTDISNNPLNCDCDLITSLNSLSHHFTKENTLLENAICKTPTRLNNVPITTIDWPKENEICKNLPKQKDQQCPEGCRCVYRPLTRSNVINCQYSDLQTYPRTLPVLPAANHTELNLYGNRLREFRMPDDPGYKNVTFLNLANNFITSLDIGGISLQLQKLDIRHNNLTTLSEETLEFLENARELERLELAGNPWKCDVSNIRLAKLLHDKNHLIRYKVTCPGGTATAEILHLFQQHETSSRRQILMKVISCAVMFLLLTVVILTVLYYRHRQKVLVYCFSSRWKVLRWLASHPDLVDEDKLYDAFIVYAHEDEMFVGNHLVPHLENKGERKYKLCLHYRDWIPGEQIMAQIGRSVRNSRRTIVVLSPNFLRSVWGAAEFRIAHAEALRDGTARVIVILYQDVSDEEVDEELKAYLQTNTYVKWGSPWFWRQLTYALPHPSDRERGVLHYFSRGRRCVEDLHSSENFEMK